MKSIKNVIISLKDDVSYESISNLLSEKSFVLTSKLEAFNSICGFVEEERYEELSSVQGIDKVFEDMQFHTC